MDGLERWSILRLHVEDDIPLTELARETGTAVRALQRWHHLFQTGGISALEPQPRKDVGTRRTPAELVAFVERLALTRPRPSIATLDRPSYATVRAIVGALDPALVTLALEGPAAYRDRHELVFRHRAERPNVRWQADHTELDILITGADGKPERPWLTTVLDDYCRAICGYMVFTGAPSAMNTALALRQAIWRKADPAWAMCGIPDVLHVDHGSDFTSHHLEYTSVALKIRMIFSTIARPQASHTATGHSGARNSCSSWTGTGNVSDERSTPTTSPPLRPSPPSSAAPAATAASWSASSHRSPEC